MAATTTTRKCLLLQTLPALPDALLCALLRASGGVEGLWSSPRALWRRLGAPPELWQAFACLRRTGRAPAGGPDVAAQEASLEACGAQVMALTDADYPPLLATIHDPPPLLYVRGDVARLAFPQLAMVGSRRASSDGLRAARAFAAAAAGTGLTVTSGLALGIDGAAHRAALSAGGASVGVMATGIDRLYPRRHRELAEALVAAGCVVTEFPPGSAPLRENFPRRNRIISGLALGVLVVEAALPSGSLITAGTALDQGREVFALPWSLYHPAGGGCLRLLRDGATLVQDIADIVACLGPMVDLQRSLSLPQGAALHPAPDSPRERLLQLVGDGRVTAEQLAEDSALSLARVEALLSELEIEGLLRLGPGGYARA